MKKVSVIIPCYNAVNTIDACLESVAAQTIGMDELEVILVNDASTDDTLEYLKRWEERYPESILVIHCSENGKQGQARNIGLSYASGEYVGFMDDDDYIEPRMYETMYRLAQEGDLDLIVCQSVKRYENESPNFTMQPSEKIVINTELDRAKFLERDINFAIWNKLYKRKLIIDHQIFFPPGTIYDDIFFSTLIKHYCQNAYICGELFYHHIIQPTSVSYGAKNVMDRIGYIEVWIHLIEELRTRGIYNQYREWYESEFFISYITFVLNFEKSFGKMNEELTETIRNAVRTLFPDFEQITIVKKIMAREGEDLYKKILMQL